MSKDITVQIKVQEYGSELYKINETGSFIRKELCTVIKTVEYVQELNEQIKDLQAKLNTYEIEESVTMKHVQPEPQRKPLGFYEGVKIYEETDAWFVDIKNLIITVAAGFDIDSWGEALEINESKVYLTPKEANARLKEEVTNKAKDYPVSITINQWFYNSKQLIDYAIEEFEKEYNVQYLTINTESK